MNSPSAPLTVLMTADTVGGVWTYALELIRALARHGVHVSLATMGKRLTLDQRRDAQAIANLEIFESEFKLEWMPEPWRDVAAADEWLLDLERRIAPDILHLNQYSHAALSFRAPKLVGAHSCVLSWWQGVNGENAPAEWQTYRDAIQRGLDGADLVVAPSRAFLETLNALYGPQRGMVIYNGRDARRFKSGPKQNFILSAGRLWDEAKNMTTLDEAACHLPWKVYVAGSNDHPNGRSSSLRHLICLGRLAERELADWLSRAAIYAAPARYEPFGLSILEAALSGDALVLGNLASLRELWNGAAHFVEPGDVEELTYALARLIRTPDHRRKLAARAQHRARDLNSDRMASSYLAAYNALLSTERPLDSAKRALTSSQEERKQPEEALCGS